MTISDPQLVTILAFVIAGLFLVQTLFLLVFVDQVNRRIRRAEMSLVKASKKASHSLQTLKQQLQQLSRYTERIPAVVHEVNKLLSITSEKARWVDEKIARDIHLSTAYVEEASRRVEFALHQFTRQTSKVRKWIRYPSFFISALIQGTFAGVRAYTRDSRQRQPETHYPDEEIFI